MIGIRGIDHEVRTGCQELIDLGRIQKARYESGVLICACRVAEESNEPVSVEGTKRGEYEFHSVTIVEITKVEARASPWVP